MNIHVTNKTLFNNLKNASLASCEFGSKMYYTNDEFSDSDIHYIYATSEIEMKSFLKSHHHIQYCDENDDVFVNLHTLIRNTINGDSTVLFEIIHSGHLKDTSLSFLYDMKDSFINYSIIRSYLGLGFRDCKHYYKKEKHRDQLKTLGHIYRGYYFAKSLMEGNFRLINEEFLEEFKKIKLIKEKDYSTKKLWLNKGQDLIKNLREELNNKFNNNTLGLPKYMTIENQSILDKEIIKLVYSTEWKDKQNNLSNFDMNIFYNAFENEINY